MEHIEDDAGSQGPRGMALVGCYIKYLARLQDVADARDRQFERAAQQQGPLLVRVGMIGDDRTGSDVNSAMSNVVRVEIAAEVAGSDLARCHGREVE